MRTSIIRACFVFLATAPLVGGCSLKFRPPEPTAETSLLKLPLQQRACHPRMWGELRVCELDGELEPSGETVAFRQVAGGRSEKTVIGFLIPPGAHTIVLSNAQPCPRVHKPWYSRFLGVFSSDTVQSILTSEKPPQPVEIEFATEGGKTYVVDCVEQPGAGEAWARVLVE